MWLCTLVLQNENEENCVDYFHLHKNNISTQRVLVTPYESSKGISPVAATPLPDIISYPLFANADTVI